MNFHKSIPNIGEFTKIPFNLLFMLGFIVIRWRPNEKSRKWQLTMIASFAAHFSLCPSAMILYFFLGSLETSLEKTAYIIYNTYAVNAFIKLFSCFFNRDKLRQGLRNIEKYYPKTNDECVAYNLDENLRRIRKYNRILTVYHFIVTSMFNFFPLMQTIWLYYQNNKEEYLYLVPYTMSYLFNTRSPFGYALAYTTQCSGSYLASCMILGSDLLLITCVHMINMNFRHLANSIREYKPTGTVTDMKKLKSFIQYHNHILDTVSLIDDTFNISILLNYVTTALMICLLGFQLVAGTSLFDLVKFLAFLISMLTHVYFISAFGTEMITLSCDISEAFFHHSWYNGNIEYKRALVLPIARAQREAHINAYKFFIISMESFQSLMSVSYQFFTLIKTRYDENAMD